MRMPGARLRCARDPDTLYHCTNMPVCQAFELKRLVGRRWAEADVQQDIKTFPFKVTEAPDGGLHINLNYEKDGGECEMKAFTPEQLLAMLFVNLKSTAEAHNKVPSRTGKLMLRGR